MKFYHTIDGKEIEFSADLKGGTTNLRIAFAELRQVLVDDIAVMQKEFKKYKNDFELLKSTEAGPTDQQLADYKKGSQEFQIRAIRTGASYTVKYMQLLLDTRQLPTEQKALIASDPDSEFWANQNLGEAENLVNSFRLANSLGE